MSSPDDPTRRADLERAVALYSGDYFEDSYSDWAIELRERVRQMYIDTLIELAKINARGGNRETAIAYYQKYIENDRDCEEVYRALMRLQMEVGDRTAAIRTYQRCVQVLRDDLDIPNLSREMLELYEQIMKG